VQLANERVMNGLSGACNYPNNLSITNDSNWTREVTVLNHGTPEYDLSSFPNVKFDAVGVANILLEIQNDEDCTQLLTINQHNVGQYNFGYDPEYSSDVTRRDGDLSVFLRPILLGDNAKFNDKEREAAKFIHGSVAPLLDTISQWVCGHEQQNSVLQNEHRHTMYAARFNDLVGCHHNRFEAFSLNIQDLGDVATYQAQGVLAVADDNEGASMENAQN
jgi:hypothetical protein